MRAIGGRDEGKVGINQVVQAECPKSVQKLPGQHDTHRKDHTCLHSVVKSSLQQRLGTDIMKYDACYAWTGPSDHHGSTVLWQKIANFWQSAEGTNVLNAGTYGTLSGVNFEIGMATPADLCSTCLFWLVCCSTASIVGRYSFVELTSTCMGTRNGNELVHGCDNAAQSVGMLVCMFDAML